MAVISFSEKPEQTWCVAGWAFRQILEDVLAQNRDDAEMAGAFSHAIRISGLAVDLLERSLANRITNSIRKVAIGILSGCIHSGIVDQPYGDKTTAGQYFDSLKELLRMLPENEIN